MNSLPLPLYHGTSTLFLNGISESGLGGKNPIANWKILEFAKIIFPLVQEHFSSDVGWMNKAQTFVFMVQQKSGSMNFQHGDTYLSPAKSTAVRYAVNKRFGSELLTYCLDFLDELIRRKVPGVTDTLYQKFPDIFGFLNISCAPLLVEFRDPPIASLLSESGSDAAHNVNQIITLLRDHSEIASQVLQQVNFRLHHAAPLSKLSFWLINVKRWHPLQPDYTLNLLIIPGAYNNGV